jgi:hypothetical protein
VNLTDLPGAEFILPGLEDLEHGRSQTVGALLVAIAATRLSQAGLKIAREQLAKEPELRLYDRLQEEQADPYAYYNALLKRLDSFCNALESLQDVKALQN